MGKPVSPALLSDRFRHLPFPSFIFKNLHTTITPYEGDRSTPVTASGIFSTPYGGGSAT